MLIVVFFVVLTALFLGLNRQSDLPTEGEKPHCWIGDLVSLWLCAFVYAGLLCVSARMFMSTLIGLGLIILLWAGNGLKKRLLGESLVFSDVFLAGHALRYPRLYFGYVPCLVWCAIAAGISVLFGVAYWEERLDSETLSVVWTVWMIVFGLGVVLLAVLIWRGVDSKRFSLSFNALDDARRYTVLGAALLHTVWHVRNSKSLLKRFSLKAQRKADTNQELRHFVLIQAESYCPLSQLTNRASVTPFMDHLAAQFHSGNLKMDWRGAYTMRTEFSVLSGKKTTDLETFAFDPYRAASRVPMDSLARDFKKAGFQTIAWHPNDGRFFDRRHVLPNLGFDRFDDLASFVALPKSGLYTGDEALLKAAGEFLAQAKQSIFLFIITMEGHGPWNLDSKKSEVEYYEDRIADLDRGMKTLTETLATVKAACHVALYGDHLPGLKIFQNTRQKATRWMLWSNKGKQTQARPMNLSVHRLRNVLRKEVLG